MSGSFKRTSHLEVKTSSDGICIYSGFRNYELRLYVCGELRERDEFLLSGVAVAHQRGNGTADVNTYAQTVTLFVNYSGVLGTSITSNHLKLHFFS